MDADRAIGPHIRMAVRPAEVKTHEPVSVGKDVTTAISEIVSPGVGVFDLGYIERLLIGALRRTAVTGFGFVAGVLAITDREGRHQHRILFDYLIDRKDKLFFGHDEEAFLLDHITFVDLHML